MTSKIQRKVDSNLNPIDIFTSQYTPHIGEVERLANKRTRKLHVTLPQSFH